MACMEHECRDCGHFWSDNKPGEERPKCGSEDVLHTFDEAFDDHGEREGDDEM